MPPIASYLQELQYCKPAFDMAIQRDWEHFRLPDKSICPLTYKLTLWLKLQDPRSEVKFATITDFLTHHPTWPAYQLLQKRAEESLTQDTPAAVILGWFNKHSPATGYGASIYAKALISTDQIDKARQVVKQGWCKNDFNKKSRVQFIKEFGSFLDVTDYQKQVDCLLWQNKDDDVKKLLKHLDKSNRSLAEARIALIKNASEKIIKRKLGLVPERLRKDPGLLYNRLKWCRYRNDNQGMLQILKSASPAMRVRNHPEAWWKELNILIRRFIEEKKYQEAYRLAKSHHLTEGESFAEAAWLTGWLALRFVSQPNEAFMRFTNLYQKVKTPISLARAAYWAGRSAKALGNQQEAQEWWTKAGAYPETFYGQLALSALNYFKRPILTNIQLDTVSVEDRERFEGREFVQIIHLLSVLGDDGSLMEPFFYELALLLKDPEEQLLLVDLAAREGSPYLNIQGVKKFPHLKIPITAAAYPLLTAAEIKLVSPPLNPMLVHAIIRQESRFRHKATSRANAQGLMQLLPSTAYYTAKKSNIQFNSLFDRHNNLALGCAHLKHLLKYFNGAMVLAIAAYNAGEATVREWLNSIGPFPDDENGIIDWIEKIPYAETRNYVQRVLENYVAYRARFGRKPKHMGELLKAKLTPASQGNPQNKKLPPAIKITPAKKITKE